MANKVKRRRSVNFRRVFNCFRDWHCLPPRPMSSSRFIAAIRRHACGDSMTKANPPVAKRVEHSHTHHNIRRDDPYAWLRADNWQEVMQKPETLDAEIRAYLEAENA